MLETLKKPLFCFANKLRSDKTYSGDGTGSSKKYASFIACSDVILFVGSMINNFCSYNNKQKTIITKLKYCKSQLLLVIKLTFYTETTGNKYRIFISM